MAAPQPARSLARPANHTQVAPRTASAPASMETEAPELTQTPEKVEVHAEPESARQHAGVATAPVMPKLAINTPGDRFGRGAGAA